MFDMVSPYGVDMEKVNIFFINIYLYLFLLDRRLVVMKLREYLEFMWHNPLLVFMCKNLYKKT